MSRIGGALGIAFGLGLLGLALHKRSAIHKGESDASPKPDGSTPKVRTDDERRLKTLDGIVPDAQIHFEALMQEARNRGLSPYIVSAVRTCKEQSNLANSTVKRGWHCLGRAVDIELAKGMAADYLALGEWWEKRGGIWGGRWVEQYPTAPCGPADAGPGDHCHFQWTPGSTGRVPLDVWPADEPCEAVAERYLTEQGGAWSPARGWSE